MVPLPGSTAVTIWLLQSGRVQNLRLTCSHPLVRRRTRSVGQSRPVRRRPGIYTPCPPGAHMCRSPSCQAFRFLRFGIRGQGGVGHAEVRHQRLAAMVEDSVGRWIEGSLERDVARRLRRDSAGKKKHLLPALILSHLPAVLTMA